MQMYCTFVLFVNKHFPGLPASGAHCTLYCTKEIVLDCRLWVLLVKDDVTGVLNATFDSAYTWIEIKDNNRQIL
jgi:hypothetical protein